MSNRNNTCIKQECKFWKKHKTGCPNYVESEWVTKEGHRYTVEDCAPKRSMILCQQIYNGIIDQRIDYHQVRNTTERMLMLVGQQNKVDVLIGHDNDNVVNADEVKQIEE